MSSKPDLVVDWCSYAAAKYAVMHWHYSRSMPTPPVLKIGVWENDAFIGAVLFSRGSCLSLGRQYGLTQIEVCELTRVALNVHDAPVSKIVGRAIKYLRNKEQGLRLIVSFADPMQQHIGAIYQAGNWVYSGQSDGYDKFRDVNGRVWHPRQVSSTGVSRQYGELRYVPKIVDCERIPQLGKYRYLYPLDRAMHRQIAPLAQPYPKKDMRPADGSAEGDQLPVGGSTPTRTL